MSLAYKCVITINKLIVRDKNYYDIIEANLISINFVNETKIMLITDH